MTGKESHFTSTVAMSNGLTVYSWLRVVTPGLSLLDKLRTSEGAAGVYTSVTAGMSAAGGEGGSALTIGFVGVSGCLPGVSVLCHLSYHVRH